MIDRCTLTKHVVITVGVAGFVALSSSPAAKAAAFTDVTADALGRATDDPATDGWSNKVELADIDVAFGDAKLGDIDNDGDLDIVAADWGDGDPFAVRGAPVAWINDGSGHFTDDTAARFPTTKTGMSWDLELVDSDNDLDLDVL